MLCCTVKDQGDKPQKIRTLTDSSCLLAFVVFWSFMTIIAVFSFTFGDPRRLTHGYDSFGNICGSTNYQKVGGLEASGLDMTLKPFVFYLNGKNFKNSMQICVSRCPDQKVSNLKELKSYFEATGLSLCRYDFDILENGNQDLLHGLNESLTLSSPFGPCPVFPIEKTEEVLKRCLPLGFQGTMYDFLGKEDVAQLLMLDIYTSWPVIIGFFFCAFISAFAIMSLFYLSTYFTSHLVLVMTILVCIGSSALLWWKYCEVTMTDTGFDCCQSESVLLSCSILATLFVFVIMLLTVYLKYRVRFLGVLFCESADCLKALPALYLQPLFTFLALSLFYVFWIFVMSYLASARYPMSSVVKPFRDLDLDAISANSTLDPRLGTVRNVSVESLKTFTHVEFSQVTWITHFWWVCVLGLIWVSEFVLACQQMVIAGAVARWYFAGRQATDKDPVWISFRYLLLYHLGSTCLGSFLITIFKIPRLLVGCLYAQYRRDVKTQNACTDCGFRTCVHCFDCFENFTAYLSHNAYTVVEMRGVNFLTAGKRAWIINTSNQLKVAKDNADANIVMFLTKVFVTTSVGCIAFLFFCETSNIHSPILPTVLVCICSFFICHCVISVFELTIDTLYLCLSEDQDINEEDGIWRDSPLVPDDIRTKFTKITASTSNSTY